MSNETADDAMGGTVTRRRGAGFTLTLTDDLVPAIAAGQYRITAAQDIEDVPTGGYIERQERVFEVRASQFHLPSGMVHAVNPYPDSQGTLEVVLPHVTLGSRTLPWARTLEPGEMDTGPVEVRPPWLALLLFAAGELPEDPEATGTTTAMTVRDLLWPDTADPTVIVPDIPPAQVIADPAELCETIRIPGAVFAAVCPREEELRYLAHVRSVNADPGLRGEALAEGDYSVLLAGRMPDARGGRHVAHLVSLEGCLEALALAGTDADEPQDRDVRLASLHRWSFDVLPAGGVGFAQRVHDLLFDDAAEGVQRDLLLRLPFGEPDEDEAGERAAQRLAEGWVPTPYQVASGAASYAWYRGPLTAAPAQPLPDPPERGWAAADGLLVYDEHWGLFDAGWACAWSIGRALALADDDFASQLDAWRTKARHRAASIAQRLAAAEPAGGADIDSAALAALAAPKPRARALRELAAGGAVEQLIRALSDVTGGGGRSAEAEQRPPSAGNSTLISVPPRTTGVHSVLRDLLAPNATAATSVFRAALHAALDGDGTTIDAWLAELRLLRGVSFACLVPGETALPPESLRLFFVDHGWLASLQAGAESVGEAGETDRALAALAAPWRERTDLPGDSWPGAGLLIRSALTDECPELAVRAWQGGEPVVLLRWEVLPGDILLVLFDRVPDTVELSEPPEGLSFGVDPHPVDGVTVINLRSLGGGERPPGQTLPGSYFPQQPGETGLLDYVRADPAGRRVLDLLPQGPGGLLQGLDARLREAGELPQGSDGLALSPAQFGLQLVNAPFQQFFLTHLPDSADTEANHG